MDNELIIKIQELPEDLRREVMDYVEFLRRKYKNERRVKKFKFDQEGGLKEVADKYTSVELQHKALEWR